MVVLLMLTKIVSADSSSHHPHQAGSAQHHPAEGKKEEEEEWKQNKEGEEAWIFGRWVTGAAGDLPSGMGQSSPPGNCELCSFLVVAVAAISATAFAFTFKTRWRLHPETSCLFQLQRIFLGAFETVHIVNIPPAPPVLCFWGILFCSHIHVTKTGV